MVTEHFEVMVDLGTESSAFTQRNTTKTLIRFISGCDTDTNDVDNRRQPIFYIDCGVFVQCLLYCLSRHGTRL